MGKSATVFRPPPTARLHQTGPAARRTRTNAWRNLQQRPPRVVDHTYPGMANDTATTTLANRALEPQPALVPYEVNVNRRHYSDIVRIAFHPMANSPACPRVRVSNSLPPCPLDDLPPTYDLAAQFRFNPISRLCSLDCHRPSIVSTSSIVADVPATSRIET